MLSGHQRLRAARALDFESVPCILITPDSPSGVLFSTNLDRQLTTMERYRLTIQLLDQMEDRRKGNGQEKDENGRFTATSTDSVKSGQNQYHPRDKVATMVSGVTKDDITTFRRIKELPQPVQQELFKFVEKENPNKRALKAKVNTLNADRRRLKAELRTEKKIKLKKKEMERLEEFIQVDIDPAYRYDAKCFDETVNAINKAVLEIPRLIADVLSFSPPAFPSPETRANSPI